MNDSSFYTTEREGEYKVFIVTPGKHQLAEGLPLPGMGLLKKFLPSAASPAGGGSKITLGNMQPYYRVARILVKPGMLGLPADLRNLYGRDSILAEDLHQIVARNQIMDDLGYGKVFTNQPSAFNVGREMRLGMAKAIGWSVDAEAGGRAYTLAFGLNEITANGLMTDIHRVLNG